MKVTGFTFIRNAVKYDYPVAEAIRSVLPLCDDFVVAVGRSDDETRELIAAIDPEKIRIVDTVWDDSLREGGRVLAEETNKAFDAIGPDTDWAFYIQGDEVLHEKYVPLVRQAMETWKNDQAVEGLLFDYVHFYGSYEYVGDSRRWYRREIRVIRNDKAIRSYKDAQGFRKKDRRLNVKKIDAAIYHYGWVKKPEVQQAKQEYFNKLWHDDEWMDRSIPKVDSFDYSQIDSLAHFTGTHPEVMLPRIQRQNWKFSFDPTRRNLSTKYRFLHFIERLTGRRIGEFRNYRVI